MVGQTISHYRITEKLGEGGMGMNTRMKNTLRESCRRAGLVSTISMQLAVTQLVGVSPMAAQPGVFVDEAGTRLPVASYNAVRAGVGDLDNDGDADVIVAAGAHTGGAIPPQDFLLLINDGNGAFTNEAAFRLPASAFGNGFAAAAILGDVDGDTDLDVW